MVGLHRLDRPDHAIHDQPEEVDERELILGVVDLPAVEGDLGPVLLGVGQEVDGEAAGVQQPLDGDEDKTSKCSDFQITVQVVLFQRVSWQEPS